MVKPLLDEAEITVSSPFLAILWHLYQPMSMEGISATLADQYRETPQGLRMLLGAFRGGNPLERIVGNPPTESGRHAVSHKKGLGVSRQLDVS
jgi:hypothetical protein